MSVDYMYIKNIYYYAFCKQVWEHFVQFIFIYTVRQNHVNRNNAHIIVILLAAHREHIYLP